MKLFGSYFTYLSSLTLHLRPPRGRELVVGVVGVHAPQLLRRGRAQHLDDLHQLVDAVLAREERLAQDELRKHAARRPQVHARAVVRRLELFGS